MSKFEEEVIQEKCQLPNSIRILVTHDSDYCSPIKRGLVEVVGNNDGANLKNMKNFKIEKD